MREQGSRTTLIAIGGGDLTAAKPVLKLIFDAMGRRKDARMVVMTVATNQVDGAYEKYNSIFRKKSICHIEMVDVSVREDSSNPKSLEKIERADLIFFTGGNQLNVTSLFGGSPMHELFKKRIREGVVVAGTSAGAAMMSTAMIMRGTGDAPPSAQAVELGPGLDLAYGTLIDTHFSQRGRHGRLMTAIAHDPQLVGIGLDEETAAVFRGDTLEVVGNGSVTIVDGTAMSHTDLVYVERGTPIGILDMRIHVLAEGYKYDLTKKLPSAPPIAAAA